MIKLLFDRGDKPLWWVEELCCDMDGEDNSWVIGGKLGEFEDVGEWGDMVGFSFRFWRLSFVWCEWECECEVDCLLFRREDCCDSSLDCEVLLSFKFIFVLTVRLTFTLLALELFDCGLSEGGGLLEG